MGSSSSFINRLVLYYDKLHYNKRFIVLLMLQGTTIGPLVRYLDVKKTNKKESINEELHIRVS